ncbi:hypothetical protein [Actinomadura montaniterrae]|uniref:Uncharacterized protein n=1 Tax=Actinomadura montaniterrae TaxID=1803903 RepID=A0A6L3VYU1_9ACTN|nr:hypothetical protein [Actinomadura montaniterrae]KAB2384593.1 hypothetical protein F9B16_10780 [Actinomadura montaniterrae]
MITPGRYDYCGLYLRGLSKDAAVDLVAQAIATSLDGAVAQLNGLEIEVLRNPGFVSDAEDFPTWPIKIEVVKQEAAPSQMVDAVSKLLTFAWRAGYEAVAACDYEDELPAEGGYVRCSPGGTGVG